jgi:hypothetical protein
MRKLKLLLTLAIVSGLVFMFSCSEDDPVPDRPTVSGPSSNPVVEAGSTVNVDFSIDAPGGFSSASVSALNGTAAIP